MPKNFVINTAASGDTQLVAAVPGRKIRVLAYAIVPAATVVTTFLSGVAGGVQTAITGPLPLGNSGIYPGFGSTGIGGVVSGHFETANGEGLVLKLGAAVQVSGYGSYDEVL